LQDEIAKFRAFKFTTDLKNPFSVKLDAKEKVEEDLL
jgi:hypothetical protein